MISSFMIYYSITINIMTTTTSNALIGSNTVTTTNAALISVNGGPFNGFDEPAGVWCSFQLPVTSVVSQFDVQISLEGSPSSYSYLYLRAGIGQTGTLLATSQGVMSAGYQYLEKISFIIPSTTLTANTYYTFEVGFNGVIYAIQGPPAFASSWPTSISSGGINYVIPYDIYAYPTSIPNNPSGSTTLYTDGLSNLQVVNPISSYNLCAFQEIVYAIAFSWVLTQYYGPTIFDIIFVSLNHSYSSSYIFTPPVDGIYTLSISIPCINPNINGIIYIEVLTSSNSQYQTIAYPLNTTITSPTIVIGGSITMAMSTNTPVTFDLISPVALQPISGGPDLHSNFPSLHIYKI
jgi:hypothetical protein